MWIFSIYGMYSVAIYKKGTATVRARLRQHLVNLQERFPMSLGNLPVVSSPNKDYAYRIEVNRRVWAAVVKTLAEEQTWNNFKDEASRFERQTKQGCAYSNALHRVWFEMMDLQKQAGKTLASVFDAMESNVPLDETQQNLPWVRRVYGGKK